MALEFRNDPTYQATESGMYGARWRAFSWGIVSTALVAGAIFAVHAAIIAATAATAAPLLTVVGLFALGAAAAGTAIYAGFKAYKAHVDERAGFADISAQRSAARIVEAMAQQPQLSQEQAMASSIDWQKKMAAQAVTLPPGQYR